MASKMSVRQEIRRLGKIQGWLDAFSAETILTLGIAQRQFTSGAIAEIGVHHGKLFFVMARAMKRDERAIAIDLFSQQDLNIDRSGKGDRAIFQKHAERAMRRLDALNVVEASSLDLQPQDILDRVGKVRIFSVDGGHTRECALNDLRLAEATLTDDGFVIMDDVFNEFWPDVMAGFADYLESGSLVPFAITPGKVYLCRPIAYGRYTTLLQTHFPLRIDKVAPVFGHPVLILGISKWTLRRAIGATAPGRLFKQVRSALRRAHA